MFQIPLPSAAWRSMPERKRNCGTSRGAAMATANRPADAAQSRRRHSSRPAIQSSARTAPQAIVA